MSFCLTINADNLSDFKTKVFGLAECLMATSDVDDGLSAETPAARRPGRPRKQTAVAATSPSSAAETTKAQTSEALEDPLADEAPKEMTMDDAKDAGRDVLAKKGVDTLREILKKFAVAKVADLKPPQFGDFIKECSTITA